MNKTIVFTSLALNQNLFFGAISKKLQDNNFNSIVITFHESSINELINKGITYYNIFNYIRKIKSSDINKDFDALMDKYQITSPHLLFSHEKAYFDIKSDKDLKIKFFNYLMALELIFEDIKKNHSDITVVQETGGFASIVSTFYLSQYLKLPHYFVEPSIFRGRLFYIKNSINSKRIKNDESAIPSDELVNYLNKIRESKKIVIPKKDEGQYQTPLKKFFNLYNIKRLFQKLIDKYLFNKREEFNHIGYHVISHINKVVNKFLFKNDYQEIPKGKFLYFPFHVPMDMALTIRTPEYFDQYTLLDFLAKNIPKEYKLAVKEHPAQIGSLDRNRLRNLLTYNENIVLLRSSINTYDILEKASMLITINSKSGAEALLSGKKLLVIGDAFYNTSDIATYENHLKLIPNTILEILKSNPPQEENVVEYFQNVWDSSCPGELYELGESNINTFTNSLIESIEE